MLSVIEMNLMGVTFQSVWTDERENSNACNCFLYGKTEGRGGKKRDILIRSLRFRLVCMGQGWGNGSWAKWRE